MRIKKFVFLKQKTEYEMRISDWSSDVCSSDLSRSISEPGKAFELRGPARIADAARSHRRDARRATWHGRPARAHLYHTRQSDGGDDRRAGLVIVRASCRERVSRYD